MGYVLMRRLVILVALCGLLSACEDSWFGETPPKALPGKRISILTGTKALEAEAGTQGDVVLPAPEKLTDWPQPGGYPPHDMQNLSLAAHPVRVWTAFVGEGSDPRRAFISQPVVADGKVFAMDSLASATAFDFKDGDRLWRVDLTPENSGDGSFGGGLAYDEGKLYVTTNFAQLIALDPKTGDELWRHTLPAPVRGGPTVRGGRILVVTVDNETLALSAEDGHPLWRHSGISEVAALVGAPSVAIDGNTVLAPYTSGELFALRIENGTVEWSDVLASIKRTDQVAELTDIRGLPVVDHGKVYAVGNSDVLAAIDLRTGRRIWDKEVGAVQTPWVAGEYVFLITNTPELACFETRAGHVKWVKPLQAWIEEKDKTGRISWTGPVLAGDRLIVVSSLGKMVSFSPKTGDILGEEELPAGVTIPPVVSGDTLLLVTEDGEMLAYR